MFPIRVTDNGFLSIIALKEAISWQVLTINSVTAPRSIA